MKTLLVDLKGELCKIAQLEYDEYHLSEIEYLLHLIDGFLLGFYEESSENLTEFIESIVDVAIIQSRFDLLDYLKPLCGMKGN